MTTSPFSNDFPALAHGVHYLDNASTTLKPQSVLDAMNAYYTEYPANVHRGIYDWSEQASIEYEAVREQVRAFVNAASTKEVIFTSGTTQSLNVAARLLVQDLAPGDAVLLTRFEHHANLIPWQILAAEHELELHFVEPDAAQQITADMVAAAMTPRTRVVALTHMSNVTGTVLPIAEITALAHTQDALVVVDAAQSAAHMPLDVQVLDVDFLALSAHKLFGPTGVGVLYGKQALLERYEPVVGGGSMIHDVELTHSTWADLPLKFEPGTPNIAGVLGFGAALKYMQHIGADTIHRTTHDLATQLSTTLRALDGVQLYATNNSPVASFTVDGVHPHDLASVLNNRQVAVRAGHHCAQPLMKFWGIPATTRASLAFYNTAEDITHLADGIQHAQSLFA